MSKDGKGKIPELPILSKKPTDFLQVEEQKQACPQDLTGDVAVKADR